MSIVNLYQKRKNLTCAKRTVAAALLLLCIAFIWHNSMEEARISGARSVRITQAVNDWLSGGGLVFSEHSIRKLAHFSEYALEGILTVFFLWAYGLSVARHACAGALLGILTALTDETIQLFAKGRDASVGDVWIDFGGFLFGFLLSVLWLWVRRKNAKNLPPL